MEERKERTQIDILPGTPFYRAELLAARTALEQRLDVEYVFNETPHVVTFEDALRLYSQDAVLNRVNDIQNDIQEDISSLGREIENSTEEAKTELVYLALAEELRTAATQ